MILEPEKYYHIYTHANGSEDLFRSEENYRYFIQRYVHFTLPVVDTLSWCLMPNHIHFVVRIKCEAEIEKTFGKFETFQKLAYRISKQFSNLFSGYTQAFNKMYERKGSLFIPNFKRKEIDSDEYLSRVIAYVHNNPLHHGFTRKPGDWPWSSYNILLSENESWLKREEVIHWFGNREEFIRFHEQHFEENKKALDDFWRGMDKKSLENKL